MLPLQANNNIYTGAMLLHVVQSYKLFEVVVFLRQISCDITGILWDITIVINKDNNW